MRAMTTTRHEPPGHLPRRPHPPHHRQTQRDFRRGLPRLPAAATLHHVQDRPVPAATPHDAALRAARAAWATDTDLRNTYRQHRPMVERSIAWLVGVRGRCRRLPYRGVIANNWWIHTRAAALNLRRLLTLGLTAPPALGRSAQA